MSAPYEYRVIELRKIVSALREVWQFVPLPLPPMILIAELKRGG